MRSTHATRLVLEVFQDHPDPIYGYTIIKSSGLKSGSVYPILHRLETSGVLRSKWEDIDPEVSGRPRRRLYWVQSVGGRTSG